MKSIHIQPPTSINLKQYNAAQPASSCTTTIDMPDSQPCSSTYTYLHYKAASTSKSSCNIQNHTPTSQHSNCHLHHTIHSEYATLHPALCPHTCIQNIFLPQHHQHMEQLKRMTRLRPNAHKHDNVWLVTTLYSFCQYIYSLDCQLRCSATIHV